MVWGTKLSGFSRFKSSTHFLFCIKRRLFTVTLSLKILWWHLGASLEWNWSILVQVAMLESKCLSIFSLDTIELLRSCWDSHILMKSTCGVSAVCWWSWKSENLSLQDRLTLNNWCTLPIRLESLLQAMVNTPKYSYKANNSERSLKKNTLRTIDTCALTTSTNPSIHSSLSVSTSKIAWKPLGKGCRQAPTIQKKTLLS